MPSEPRQPVPNGEDADGITERYRRWRLAAVQGRAGAAAALTAAKDDGGLAYRRLSGRVGVPITTLQGWLTGRSAPQVGMRADFLRLVEALDLVDPEGTRGGVTGEDWWRAIRSAPAPVTAPDPEPSPPYPGMRPYELGDAHLFPGRHAQVAELAARLRRRLDGRGSPLLLVTGRSGVGKSSLVAAAVRRVADEREGIPARRVQPGPEVEEALAELAAGTGPRVLVLDQAEALWSGSEPERERTLARIAAAAATGASGTVLILVLRADALAPATDVPALRAALETAHVVIGPITREDALEILQEPTAAQGIALDPGVAEVILRDAGAEAGGSEGLSGALPLLSQTMRTLWQQREDAVRITLEDYERSGGVARSVERAAEAAYAQLSPAAREACWPTLREMLHLDESQPARRRLTAGTVPVPEDPAREEVLRTFLAAHLLQRDRETITIGHDLLLTTWPRLAEWIASAQDWSASRRMLTRYATFWDEAGRPEGLAAAPDSALVLAAERPEDAGLPDEDLSHLERDFLAAVREAREERLRRAEAENTALRRSSRRFRTVSVLASALAVIALVLAGSAAFSALTLSSAERTALAGEIANRSEVVAETMPAEAAQLAIAAHGIDDNPTSRSRLFSLTAGTLPRRITTAPGPAGLAAVDGLLAHGGAQGIVRLLDPASGRELHSMDAAVTDIYALSLVEAGDRRLLAVAGENATGVRGQGCVWDVTAAPVELGCVETALATDAAVVLPDGSGALFGGSDGHLHRLRIEDDRTVALDSVEGPPQEASGEASPVLGLDARGAAVLASREDGTLALLEDPLGETAWGPALTLPLLNDVSLSPEGDRFAASTRDHTVEIGTVQDGELEVTATAEGFESWVNDAAFLEDGRLAAVASDHTLRLFTLEGEASDVQVLPSLPDALVEVDGALVTNTADGTVTIWPDDTFLLPEERGRVFEVVADTHGRTAIGSLGSGDGRLQVDRLGEDGAVVPLEVPEATDETRYALAVTSDGRFVAYGGREGLKVSRVGETGLSDPTRVDPLPGALLINATFSADGTRLAIGDQDSDEVVVYDVAEDPGAGGADVRLTELARIPVLAGNTMTFRDRDTLVVEDGTWDLLVWDLEADEELARIDMGGQRPTWIEMRPGHPGQLGYATESLEAGIMDISDPTAPSRLSTVTGMTDTPISLSFTAEGDRMAISAVSHVDVRDISEDGTAISGSQLRLQGPIRSEITDAEFLDDGTRMVASTYSGHLWWWTLDPAEARSQICSEVGEPLTVEEGQELAPSLPDDAPMCS